MPLQKSNSDLNGRTNFANRSTTWARSKSSSAAPCSFAVPKPPLAPVSESTKNKLRKFHFEPYDDADADGDKPPSSDTPLNRLAWTDLAVSPDAPRPVNRESPNDRVLWNNARYSSPRKSPMVSRKSKTRKRARSSSPVSSPARNSPINLARSRLGSQSTKPAPSDPASELWGRLSHNSSDTAAPLGALNPALAHVMVSSSPRPGKGAFRRAVSCGENWPKRRKVERVDLSVDTLPQNSTGGPSSNMGMISDLLESVNDEICAKQKSIPNAIEASPSPEKRYFHLSSATSAAASQGGAISRVEPQIPHAVSAVAPDTSSEYGDDDFDDDIFMELDASIMPSVTAEEPTLTAQDYGSSELEKAPKPLKETQIHEFGGRGNEFDDMDDDIFAEAEGLVGLDTKEAPELQNRNSEPSEKQIGTENSTSAEDDIYGDDFGDDFDFDAAEIAATQAMRNPNGPSTSAQARTRVIRRYLVKRMFLDTFLDSTGRERSEKILIVEADKSVLLQTISLREDWIDTPVHIGSYVHVIGDFDSTGRCVVDNSRNMLILHPDQLISATTVADSFHCTRKAVLQDRVKATSGLSPPLVYGTILHEIFQEALLANAWTSSFLEKTIIKLTERHVEDLYIIKVSVEDARMHLRSKMGELMSWAHTFISPEPKTAALAQGRNGDKVPICVNKLLDVEEHVWSPMFGLKGNIDATVQVAIQQGNLKRTLTVPFEVKTGKSTNTSHQAQTALYTLLMSDRYDIEIACGLLYYMESSQVWQIPTIRHEIRHMIIQRNILACYIREREVLLPDMKRATNMCGKCYAKVPCFIYHRLADNGDGETSGMKGKFDEVVGHLNHVHQEFFLKWEDLLTKEEKESQKLKRELWTMVSSEREKLGPTPPPGFSFLESQLAVGEPIVVSDEEGHFALALGFVTAVRKHRITVAVDRRLHNSRIRQDGFDELNNQVFTGIMDAGPQAIPHPSAQESGPIRYRLDKDEFSNGMSTACRGLAKRPPLPILSAPSLAKAISVLLTSYTHTAVDNILLKLKSDSISILRLGAPAKIHPEVQGFVTLAGRPMSSFEEIKHAWHDTPVVATTCLDEASQLTLPVCLGPIRMARRFVLVGDHNQLPPLVQNEDARKGGLDVSLFKLLSDTHPDSVVNLEHQYRMCEDIMTLSNTLIYNGRLKCGTEALKTTKLHVPNVLGGLALHHYTPNSLTMLDAPKAFCPGPETKGCWLRDLVAPETTVKFVNTDTLGDTSREENKGNRIVNPAEVNIVTQLVAALISTGVPANEIGVMTHYRSQLSLLKHGLRGYGEGNIEMHTADRFQGRDKEVVVLSLVRSNEACSIGELLKDWRRINVAFTRAKTKLVVIGSRNTLKGSAGKDQKRENGMDRNDRDGGAMLSRFVRLMEERDWVLDLPANALVSHVFEERGMDMTCGSGIASTPGSLIKKSQGKSPRKRAASGGSGKENRVPTNRARAGERALLRNKPVLRDIFNDITGGGY